MSHQQSEAQTDQTQSELRERVITAAYTLFDARGYSVATMEEVCSEACLDSETVTRIFPTKYSLFRECMLSTARDFLAATDIAASVPQDSRQARATLLATIESLARAYIARRTSGGFIRGEHRYLDADDQRELRDIHETIHSRIAALLQRVRPTVSPDDIDLLARAAASTLGSVMAQPTVLPDQKLQTLLTVSAMRLLESESALTAQTGTFGPIRYPSWVTDDSNEGRVLGAAIELIYRNGFSAVSFEDIARETGFPAAAIQQRAGSTPDLLSAAFATGGGTLRNALLGAAEAAAPLPRNVLLALSHTYVEHVFLDPKLMSVFILDAHHLPPQHAAYAMELHKEFMDGWLECILAIRPELAAAEATFLVYAALRIVEDIGSHTGWEYDDEMMAKIERLVVATVIGGR